ncbi:polysaccharide pyruvyl transferase family protein [Geodermatophilus sp. SYSU D00710]
MRTLVAWADPESPNMGVRVLAQGLRDGLPSNWHLEYVSHRSPLASGPLLARRSLAAMAAPTVTRRELADYDLMIDVGEGDSFASIYGLRRLLRITALKGAARRAKVPVVLAPQTLGPWRGPAAQALGYLGLRACDAAWARDSSSERRAERYAVGKVRLASDLVFCVKAPNSGEDSGDSSPIGLNVSGLLWQPNNHVPSDRYQAFVHALLAQLQRKSVPVRLVAHVIAAGSQDDDSACTRELAAQYDNVEPVIPADLTGLRAAIAGCSLMLGARMHACLNALSLGVPTIPLAYSDKFASLFADLGYPAGWDLRQLADRVLDPNAVLASAPTLQETRRARADGIARSAAFIESLVCRYA